MGLGGILWAPSIQQPHTVFNTLMASKQYYDFHYHMSTCLLEVVYIEFAKNSISKIIPHTSIITYFSIICT